MGKRWDIVVYGYIPTGIDQPLCRGYHQKGGGNMPAADSKHANMLKRVTFRPIFVIGDHRSGTTLLYQLLAATGGFQVLTAYHIIQYDELLTNHIQNRTEEVKQNLRERFARLGLGNRILDNVQVSPDLPEEYRFVIEDSPRPKLRPSNLPRFIQMCQKLRFACGADKPILLKNPWDCLNFVFLYRTFPEAKFVFLQRNPLAVIDSQLRATHSIFTERNEYLALLSPWYAGLFRSRWKARLLRILSSPGSPLWMFLVPRHVIRANRYFIQNISLLPKDSYFSLRYEDLCRSPREIIGALLRFLGVSPETPVAYNKLVVPRAMSPQRLTANTLRNLEPYLTYHGYTTPI
jgi:hypothetical protein